MTSSLVRQMLFREVREERLRTTSPPNADGSLCEEDNTITLGRFVRLLDGDDAPARRVPDPLSRLWWEFSKHTEAAAREDDGFIDAVKVGAGATEVVACPSEWSWRGRVHAASFHDADLRPETCSRALFDRVFQALQYNGAAVTIGLYNCDLDDGLVKLLAAECFDLRIVRSRVEDGGGLSWLGAPTAAPPQLRRLELCEVNLSAWALRDFLGGVVEASLPVELHRDDSDPVAYATVLGNSADAVGGHMPHLRRLRVTAPTRRSIEGNAAAVAIWDHVTGLSGELREKLRAASHVSPPPPGRRNPPGMAERAIAREVQQLAADRPTEVRFPSLRIAHRRIEHLVLDNDGSPFVFCLHDATGLPRVESTEVHTSQHHTTQLVSMRTTLTLLTRRAFSFAAHPRQFLPGLRDVVHFGSLVMRLRLGLPLPVVERVLSFAIQLSPTLRVDIPQRTYFDTLGNVMDHMPSVAAADLATFGYGASCPVVARHMAANWAEGFHERAGTPSVFGACCFRRFQHRRDAAQTMGHGMYVDIETALQSAGWHTGAQVKHWSDMLNDRSQDPAPPVLSLHKERLPRTRDLVEHLLPGAPVRRLSVVMDSLRLTISGHETKSSYPNDALYGDAVRALLFAPPPSLWIGKQLTSVHYANVDALTPDGHIQPLLDQASSLTSLSLHTAVSNRFVHWDMRSPTLRHLSVAFFSCVGISEWELPALETLTLESVNCVNSVTRDAFAPVMRETGELLEQPAPEKRADPGRFTGVEFVGDTMENVLMSIVGGSRHPDAASAWAKRDALLEPLPDAHREAMQRPVAVGVRLPALRELSLLNGDGLFVDALVPELALDIISDPATTPPGLERIVLKNLPHIASVNLSRAHCPGLSSVELFGAVHGTVEVPDCPQVVRRRKDAHEERRGHESAMNDAPRGGHSSTAAADDTIDGPARRRQPLDAADDEDGAAQLGGRFAVMSDRRRR